MNRTGYIGILLSLCVILSGCATATLKSARQNYYAGRLDLAAAAMDGLRKFPDKNRVLYRMERGMIRQSAANYEGSSADFITAYDDLEELERYSVSRGGASWVVNDNVYEFRGAPYERTLLHAFTAKNHMALGHWNDAAVEARRIIRSLAPGTLRDYPDDAYCRYIAGFALELTDDPSNAQLQYRKAAALAPWALLDPKTGRFSQVSSGGTNEPSSETWPAHKPAGTHELVCFVSMGRSYRGPGNWGLNLKPASSDYAELYHRGEYLGRSHALTDTIDLSFNTRQRESARKSIKSTSRVAVKEAIAGSLEYEGSELLGQLVRLVLVGLLEQPDVRGWETLPRSLQVARVPCPAGLTEYDIVFKNAAGHTTSTHHVERPLQKHRNTYVSFCRDLRIKPPAR